jgi:predicted GIY-YIG superfamily endonuclease
VPAPEAFIVYVLRSVHNRGRYYVGVTQDVERRLAQHNGGLSVHTSRWRPWQLVVSIEFADPVRARAFEGYLKTGSGRAFCRAHF